MKKTLWMAALALTSVSMVHADYTWTGAAGDGDWSNQQNWDLNGATWGGTGPMTSGSNMWGTVVINNGDQVTVSQIEGWAVKVDLSNGSSLTVGSSTKMQGDNTHIIVREDAGVYTQTIVGPYKDNTFTFDVYRKGGMVLNINPTSTGDANVNGNTVVNLGVAGSMTFASSHDGGLQLGTGSGGTLTLHAELIGAALAPGDAQAEYEVVFRELLTLDGVSFSSVSYNFGEGLTLADAAITANNAADNVGKYYVSTSDTGGVTVSYVRLIPEPTAATLSLLALAGLAARRRRK